MQNEAKKKQKKQKTKLVSHGAWGKCTIKHLGLVKESSPSQKGQGSPTSLCSKANVRIGSKIPGQFPVNATSLGFVVPENSAKFLRI